MAINVELENLYLVDKKEREELDASDKESLKALVKHYQQRRARLKEILPQIDTDEIWNCHYMSYLFLNGENIEDYKLAHAYAKKAVEMGSKVTKWLYAASLDRCLVAQGKPQKFGTQFKQVKGEWELLPVDDSVTDEERAQHGVAPLSQALQKFKEKYS